MNPQKHTPGPWHITAFVREPDQSTPTGRRARIVSECESADGYLIAAANAAIADIARRGGLSDARLIAAAPDLLAALQDMVSLAYRHGLADVAACVVARAAIEKAEGGQP